MITSSAEPASSFITRYTIWRREGSLFWKSFETVCIQYLDLRRQLAQTYCQRRGL